MNDEGWNKYWIWSLPTGQLQKILLEHAKHEHPFARFCIREAMINRDAMERKPSKEDTEALEEDFEF
jgi:hypothetical protein